jgi:hypothetical protein
MPITLIVQNVPYQYPQASDSPGWGQQATAWAQAVTTVLNDLLGPNDILETSFAVNNNVSSFTNVAGLTFDPGTVRSATIIYSVYRISTDSPSGQSESGIINLTYDNNASSGSKWSLIQYGINGDAGVTFSVLYSGQVQYTSSNMSATGYSGVMHFSARTLSQ